METLKILTAENTASIETLKTVVGTQSIDDVAADIFSIVSENTALKSGIAETEKSLDATKGLVTESTAIITDLKSQLSDANTEKEIVEEVNKNLQAQVEKLSAPGSEKKEQVVKEPVTIDGKSFENSGKKYGFNYPKLTIDAVVIDCDMVIADAKLQEKLIELGHSMIKEVE